MKCVAKGKFYYRIDNNCLCYLSSLPDGIPQVFLSNDISEKVIDEDETFGMLVGGDFAYYGIKAEVAGILKESKNNKYFDTVNHIRLESDLGFQNFD